MKIIPRHHERPTRVPDGGKARGKFLQRRRDFLKSAGAVQHVVGVDRLGVFHIGLCRRHNPHAKPLRA
jgi:hypothetical protein